MLIKLLMTYWDVLMCFSLNRNSRCLGGFSSTGGKSRCCPELLSLTWLELSWVCKNVPCCIKMHYDALVVQTVLAKNSSAGKRPRCNGELFATLARWLCVTEVHSKPNKSTSSPPTYSRTPPTPQPWSLSLPPYFLFVAASPTRTSANQRLLRVSAAGQT